MEESKRKDFSDTFKKYMETYQNYLSKVSEETFKNFPEETCIIIEFINNWIDIIPVKEEWKKYIHSILGIFLFYSWKLFNWIGYEILSGKYFEAFRNCRFVFEASILSVIMEDAIESRVYEKWENLSSFDLKCEILRLWEDLKDEHIYWIKDEKNRTKKIREFIKKHVSKLNLPEERKEEYLEVYCSILCDERLGYNTPKMIEECKEILSIEDKEQLLKNTWKILNKYTHFTHTFCNMVLNNPDFVFIETMNKDLFKECFKAYFTTMDLFYCVLCWSFPKVKERMKDKVIGRWNENFNRRLEFTERIIEDGKNEAENS